jgi:cytochrome oxidase Cu insertion factor (SCO1/SenC/PrrC family)
VGVSADRSFGLTVKRRATGGVDHPAWTFLIDRQGSVRYRYVGGLLEVETVLADIRRLEQ